jgi:protein-disulfide isomerase
MSQKLTLAVGPRDHVLGPDDAPVTLVEYGDYECPHCGLAYGIVKAVQEAAGPKLRFVFRNFPLRESHPHAEAAAESAEAAAVQGKFWEMHDVLFENQTALGLESMAHYARAIGIDVTRFKADLHAHAFANRVQEDFISGAQSGVNGTPTFFINGHRHEGSFDPDTLLAAIEAAAQ